MESDSQTHPPTARLYLDHAATTPLRPEALEAMLPFLRETFANPSSIHQGGQVAARALTAARRTVADALGARPSEIVFTSGGSEADSLAIAGVLALSPAPMHLITSAAEHHAVLHAAQAARRAGHRVTILPVDREGFVEEDALRAALDDGQPALVSIMHGNNEIGTLNDIARLAAVAHERGALFHTDAVQTVGHVAVDVRTLGVDLLSLSAHKFEGPKGVGALYVRTGVAIAPLVHGGGQEGGRRAGTENVPGIVGMAAALRLAVTECEAVRLQVAELRDRLVEQLTAGIPDCALNGPRERRLPNNVNLRFDGIEGDALVVGMDLAGIEISTGSACSSGSLAPSHVLTAIGLSPAQARSSIRISLGRTTTQADVERVIAALPPLVARLRGLQGAFSLAPGEA
jgi:cysteine desulfurase